MNNITTINKLESVYLNKIMNGIEKMNNNFYCEFLEVINYKEARHDIVDQSTIDKLKSFNKMYKKNN